MVHPSAVDLVVPVKSLNVAKSRLRRTLRHFDDDVHRVLALAMVSDTVAAALRATRVRRVAIVTPDPDVLAAAAALGAVPLRDWTTDGLNASLTLGESSLRGTDPNASIGVLQADLPALRPVELDDAIATAGGKRAICADRHRSGTTLLLAGHAQPLNPLFGVGSAEAHRASGALILQGQWPTLRCDVDTADDLAMAASHGLGPRTRGAVAQLGCLQALPLLVGANQGCRAGVGVYPEYQAPSV